MCETRSRWGSSGGYSCRCPAGWNGTHCENSLFCSTNPCKNGATCVGGTSGYTCTCAEGWTGRHCEKQLWCTDGPCQNDGVCFEGSDGFYCFCSAGWTGDRCDVDINECDAGMCSEGCVNSPGSYTCNCAEGYSGQYCNDINECEEEPHPCGENTECENTRGSYRCNCVDGFKADVGGYNCTDIDECDPVYRLCSPHANCTNTLGSYVCTCKEGFSGNGTACHALPNTTIDIVTTAPTPSLSPADFGWSVGGSIVEASWSPGDTTTIDIDCDRPGGARPCISSDYQVITNVTSHSGSQSWNYKRGRRNGEPGAGTPFSPQLNVAVGRSDGNYTGQADSFYASFWFKAAKEYTDGDKFGDGSRIMVAAGDPEGTWASSNYLEVRLESKYRAKVSVRTRESWPSYEQCSQSKDCGDDFGYLSQDGYQVVAENLEPTEWHRVEMTLRAKPEDYADEWRYVVDGRFRAEGGAYYKTKQYDEGRYLYVNRLNFAAMHPPDDNKKGFYFDDVYYKAFNSANPNVILDEYRTSFEAN
ncbi:uncharacterized protein LOC144927998 [Branchiostoma floridae x Branchiostoma belcheri]